MYPDTQLDIASTLTSTRCALQNCRLLICVPPFAFRNVSKQLLRGTETQMYMERGGSLQVSFWYRVAFHATHAKQTMHMRSKHHHASIYVYKKERDIMLRIEQGSDHTSCPYLVVWRVSKTMKVYECILVLWENEVTFVIESGQRCLFKLQTSLILGTIFAVTHFGRSSESICRAIF